MKQYNVGIIGASGMVGQRFITILKDHPWFKIGALAASARSAGKSYGEAVEGRWMMKEPLPADIAAMTVLDASADAKKIAESVDFVFCAVDMKKDEVRVFEEMYARLECPVMSNNSAHRATPDVPMIVPEINDHHAAVIETQRKRLGTKRGFIAVKSNCSIQSYVPAIHPLLDLGVSRVLACTYQAISGAGKNFETWPEMVDNVIPYIAGEEVKSDNEPLKIWGSIENGVIVPAKTPNITSQCIRVPVTDGHLAAVFMSLDRKVDMEEIRRRWSEYKGAAQKLNLPSAPKQFLHYFEENDRPQTRLDRDLEGGMAISVGRLRPDSQHAARRSRRRRAHGGAAVRKRLLISEEIL